MPTYETGLDTFPEVCPWAVRDEVLSETWWPGVA